MNIRENTEELELKYLSEYACKSKFSKGRKKDEKKCDIRTCFQRDRDRITHSKAFRRLMHKTQVFISPEGDHYRTRLTHTLEVSQIARTISMALRLNENLTEAIALGHDLGHTPFGHLGEKSLNKLVKDGFRHNEQSIRVVEKLEKDGEGLNLTQEVIDGILNHRGSGKPQTLEGKVVQISDKIAYINHDIDDAIRAGILKQEELPKDCIKYLGVTSRDRINFLICNIIENSINTNDIIMDKDIKAYMYKLRAFLFENLYEAKFVKEEHKKYNVIIENLYDYFNINFNSIPPLFINLYNYGEQKDKIICDYIAGMTDRYALRTYDEIKF